VTAFVHLCFTAIFHDLNDSTIKNSIKITACSIAASTQLHYQHI